MVIIIIIIIIFISSFQNNDVSIYSMKITDYDISWSLSEPASASESKKRVSNKHSDLTYLSQKEQSTTIVLYYS